MSYRRIMPKVYAATKA